MTEKSNSVFSYLGQHQQKHIINIWQGVDKADMMLSLYRTKCRTRKWYHRIFIQLLHLAVVNSWVIYQEVGGRGNLLDFLINISRCLMNSNDSDDFDPEPVAKRRASVKANQVPNEIRKDKTDHWPLQIEGTTQRCKLPECKRRTRFICSKCQVTLCVIGSDCFLTFHGIERK